MKNFCLTLMALIVAALGAQAGAAKAHSRAPTTGVYYYCSPDGFKVETLKVTPKNVANLGSDAVHLVCATGSDAPPTCSLETLVSVKSLKVKDANHFSWTPQSGEDCGVGCGFSTIQFAKNKAEFAACGKKRPAVQEPLPESDHLSDE